MLARDKGGVGVVRLRGHLWDEVGVWGGWQTVKQHPSVTLTGCRSHPPKSQAHIFINRNIWSPINLIRKDTYLSVSRLLSTDCPLIRRLGPQNAHMHMLEFLLYIIACSLEQHFTPFIHMMAVSSFLVLQMELVLRVLDCDWIHILFIFYHLSLKMSNLFLHVEYQYRLYFGPWNIHGFNRMCVFQLICKSRGKAMGWFSFRGCVNKIWLSVGRKCCCMAHSMF